MAGVGSATGATFWRLVRGVDFVSRRVHGITEFDPSADCLLRIAMRRAGREIFLADGVSVRADDTVIELHLWNEHLPIPEGQPDLRWAAAGRRQFIRSLDRLADHIRAESRFDAVRALMMTPALTTHQLAKDHSLILVLLGRNWMAVELGPDSPGRLYRLVDNMWLWLLTRTFNPKSLTRRQFTRRRREFWISRERFLAIYGEGSERPQRRTKAAVPGSKAQA